MKVFVSGRQMGKTQKCIEWAAENDAYIVCHSQQEASRIFNHPKKQGFNIRFPITFDELLEGLHSGGVQSLVYDNVDLLLAHLARGRRVAGWTATKSESNL